MSNSCNPVNYIARLCPLSMELSRQELECLAISFFRGFSQPGDQTHHVTCIGRRLFTSEPPGKPHSYALIGLKKKCNKAGPFFHCLGVILDFCCCSWLTIFCWYFRGTAKWFSKECIYKYIYIYIRFFSIIGYYKILNIVPCAIW